MATNLIGGLVKAAGSVMWHLGLGGYGPEPSKASQQRVAQIILENSAYIDLFEACEAALESICGYCKERAGPCPTGNPSQCTEAEAGNALRAAIAKAKGPA